MQKLVQLIVSAVAFIAGLKSANVKLKTELDASNATVAEQATTIENLKKQVADDEVDDTALEKAANDARTAADEAKARADALQSEMDAANAEGEKLAAEITANPETPNVDADFKVVE